MSDMIKQLQNPVYFIFLIIGVVLFFVLDLFLLNNNTIFSVLLAVVVTGVIGLIYNDFVEKRKLEDERKAKTQDLNRRKKVQMEKEAEEGKCISCLTPLPPNAEKCSNCGFKVKHYNMKE